MAIPSRQKKLKLSEVNSIAVERERTSGTRDLSKNTPKPLPIGLRNSQEDRLFPSRFDSVS